MWGVLLLGLVSQAYGALSFSNKYVSPRNRERARREATQYIILHTTEAEAKSSLNKLSRNGEAHYCVDRDGKVYRIIERDRVAYHCGTSMWAGRKKIDSVSVGIEVVGYHDRALTIKQYRALKELILVLQKVYNVKDANVMPHAQVAYGTPNRWHRKSHRGRKRCGMGYATPGVRKLLGLTERWLSDPDVRAKRLTIGDRELHNILYAKNGTALLPYRLPATNAPEAPQQAEAKPEQTIRRIAKGQSAWDLAREAYDAASTTYIFPDGKKITGNLIRDWSSILPGTQVIVAEGAADGSPLHTLPKGTHPQTLIGDAVLEKDTWYFRPTGGVVQGSNLNAKSLAALPAGTKILVGYTRGGPVRTNRLPSQITPSQWDAPDTFYLQPGKPLLPFNQVDMKRVPPGTIIFYHN